jgi:Fe-S-cluster containining protein
MNARKISEEPETRNLRPATLIGLHLANGGVGMAGTKAPWYSKGLQFECTNCGDCCTGEAGYVWVTQEEILLLASQLREPVRDFEKKYVRLVKGRYSLRERPNGDCVFFDPATKRCTVYSMRPPQCRAWPFWRHNLKSPKTWDETCKACPGSGAGRLYPLEEIEEKLRLNP